MVSLCKSTKLDYHGDSPAMFARRATVATLTLLSLGLGCIRVVPGTEPWTPPDYWAEEHYVELEGLRICYLESGPKDAPTIMFVHGWSGNVQNWWEQFDHFQH